MKTIYFICIFLFLILTSVSAIAEVCPTIENIKANQLNGWQAFDLNGGEPIDAEQLKEYEANARYFAEAEYFDDAAEGPAQCYYQGEYDTDFLNVYLAKHHFEPDYQTGYWKKTHLYNAQCVEADSDHCVFIDSK